MQGSDLSKENRSVLENTEYRYVSGPVPYIKTSLDAYSAAALLNELGIRVLDPYSGESDGYKIPHSSHVPMWDKDEGGVMASNPAINVVISADAKTKDGELFLSLLKAMEIEVKDMPSNRFSGPKQNGTRTPG